MSFGNVQPVITLAAGARTRIYYSWSGGPDRGTEFFTPDLNQGPGDVVAYDFSKSRGTTGFISYGTSYWNLSGWTVFFTAQGGGVV